MTRTQTIPLFAATVFARATFVAGALFALGAAAPARASDQAAIQDANAVAAQSAYTAQVRAIIEARKLYPNAKEARLERPEGAVQVWFVLDRQGTMVDAGLAEPSTAMPLNRAALTSVKQGRFPAMPAEAFAGQQTARFTVWLDYTI